MSEVPKAHRRLVPRVPKKDPAEDLELTAERVVISVSAEESMEMELTTQLPAFDASTVRAAEIDDGDLTAKRPQVEPSELDFFDDDAPFADPVAATEDPDAGNDNSDDDDEHDASETFAIPARAATEPPPGPPRSFVLSAPAHLDEEVPPVSLPMASQHRFEVANAKFAKASQVSMPNPPELRPSQPDLDLNAFADLEPTSLKAPLTPHDAEDRPTTHISPAERGLLAAMSEGHEASRLVYVSWLERRGEKQRAEFLRLEHSLAAMSPLDIRHQETQDRLRELAQKISVDWRSRVARSMIENCNLTVANARCPGYWRALPADADDVRTCATCGEQVFYCVTIDLARGRVAAGQRVALDVTVERAPDDLLEARCAGCNSQLPNGTRFCPHCGRSTMY